MFVKGKVIDIIKRTVTPKNGQDFSPFDLSIVSVKESPESKAVDVTCNPENIPDVKIGGIVELMVWIRHYSSGYEIKHSVPR